MDARLWRSPPGSAKALRRHIRQEQPYYVQASTGRPRVGGETLTVPRRGGVVVGLDPLRPVGNGR